MWTHIRNITQSEKLGTEGEILQTFFKLNSTTGNINLCSEKPERWFHSDGEGSGVRELLELSVFPLSCAFKMHDLYCTCVMLQ